MLYTDCHLHSYHSSDSNASMESVIEHAIHIGIKKLCFTDHMDIDFPQQQDLSFIFDCDKYFNELTILKEKYKNQIELFIGVELGLQPHVTNEMRNLVHQYPFDFIIGSTHIVNGQDPYDKKYWEGISEEEGIRKYFQSIIDNCKVFSEFHVYGHLDYVVRYAPNKGMGEFKYNYNNYQDIIDQALKSIIHIGKGIEINTAGLKYNLGYAHPQPRIIERYKELGGEIITIGSDAHKPEHLAYQFDVAKEILIKAGFKYYAFFEKGKPQMIQL